MNTLQAVMRQQRDWAERWGKEPDAKGYLPSVRANLFQGMAQATLSAFEEGAGQELRDSPRHPASMRAAHSSSALAVNVFGYWVDRDCGPLQQALGMEAPISRIAFEQQFPTGLQGTPPHLDIVITSSDGSVLALESKFTEWFHLKRDEPFRSSYFPKEKGCWQLAGLPERQRLAKEMHDAYKERQNNIFCRLDAPQLLKHALGLACGGKQFSLGYIYFDTPGDERDVHLQELEQFGTRVGQELNFQAIAYQDLFKRLQASINNHVEYLDYLASRYLNRDPS